MRVLKNIVHLTIVLALLAAGFPMLKGDVNLDERLDLADAVLSVRSLARSVDSPAAFEKNVENALISLAAAAGAQKAIKADDERAIGNAFTAMPPAVLLASFLPVGIFQSGMHPADAPFLYKSVYLTPSTPPPLCA